MVALGDLRHRVAIQYKVRGASDAAGGNVGETWPTLATVWAKIEQLPGRELAAGDAIVHRQLSRITIRRRTDVTGAMRVNYKGRILAIVGMRDLEEAGWRYTELTCDEGAPS